MCVWAPREIRNRSVDPGWADGPPPCTGRITCLRLQLPGMAGARHSQDRVYGPCPNPRWAQGRWQQEAGSLRRGRGTRRCPQRSRVASGTFQPCASNPAQDWVTGCPRPASRWAGTQVPEQSVTPQQSVPPQQAGPDPRPPEGRPLPGSGLPHAGQWPRVRRLIWAGDAVPVPHRWP